MKIGCVVQGDLRVPLKPILNALGKSFDSIVVSTWLEDRNKCPSGKYELLLNEKPIFRGVTNRNLQRYSTARGIDVLERQGCTHVLKWRTDLLPTKLHVTDLLKLSELKANNEFGGGIVTGCFRHLSVNPDWFSSLPDLYSFSTIKAAKMLWSDEVFSYTRQFNMPDQMKIDLAISDVIQPDSFEYKQFTYNLHGIYAFDAHTEFYSIFKDRLQKMLLRDITHPEIVSKYFSLVDENHLGICWLKANGIIPYRPLRQGYNLHWWMANQKSPTKIYSFDELQNSAPKSIFWRGLWAIPVRFDLIKQIILHSQYKLNKKVLRSFE